MEMLLHNFQIKKLNYCKRNLKNPYISCIVSTVINKAHVNIYFLNVTISQQIKIYHLKIVVGCCFFYSVKMLNFLDAK